MENTGPNLLDLSMEQKIALWLDGTPIQNLSQQQLNPDEDDSDHDDPAYARDRLAPIEFESEDSDEEPDEDEIEILVEMGLSAEIIRTYGILLSAGGIRRVTASEAQNHAFFPSYPSTSISGILHFVYFDTPLLNENCSNEDAMRVTTELMSNVQFSHKHLGQPNKIKCKLLGEDETVNCWHRSFNCTGIKHCEYAHQDILRKCPEYNSVKLQNLTKLRKEMGARVYGGKIRDSIKQSTENWYTGFRRNWNISHCEFKQGEHTLRTCETQLPRVFQRRGFPFLGCPRHSDSENWHTSQPISTISDGIDRVYLRHIADADGILEPKHECTWVGQVKARRTLCGFDHPQGPGKVLQRKCKAKWDIYIPLNMHKYSFICILARDEHTHHPPFPTTLPIHVQDEVIDLIKRQDMITTTKRRITASVEFQRLCERYEEQGLQVVRAALNCEDHIAVLLRKTRLQMYPLGVGLLAVEREFTKSSCRPSHEQWIRAFQWFNNKENFIVICCTYAQAKAFRNAHCLEMDLSFKMVQGKTNVFSICGWQKQTKRIEVYCYAFINSDTRKMYFELFKLMFQVLENVGGQVIHFAHMLDPSKDTGIHTITVDMCKKQAPGLGDYLHSRHPQYTWQEHLMHVLIFCKVHVQRNFAKKFPQHPVRPIIGEIWDFQDSESLERELVKIYTKYPELKNWCKNKMADWILAGLAKDRSRIPGIWWDYARKHSGLSESSHFQENNFTGRKLNLLAAVLSHIRNVYNSIDIETQFGVSQARHNRSDCRRIAKQMAKKDKRYQNMARKRLTHAYHPYNPANPYDTPRPSNNLSASQSVRDISSASVQRLSPTPSLSSQVIDAQSVVSESFIGSQARGKRRMTQNTQQSVEDQAYAERMKKKQERLRQLRNKKEEDDIDQQIRELEEQFGRN